MALAYRRDAKTTEPRISATDARIHFGELLQYVTDTAETVVIERHGREVAAIVPIETYRRERSGSTADLLDKLHAIQEGWQSRLDPRVPVDAARMIREGHEESDA